MKKNIIVGVCGSIASYKVIEIIRRLKEKKWEVKVVMTEEAKKFINPLTFEVISQNPVYTDLFAKREEVMHISLSEFASVILIVPATANIIGKISCGICDDLLTCVVCSSKCKIIFAPAMDENMWKNKIVQENVKKLKKLGYLFIGPEKGKLASGKTGIGRLASTEKIVNFIESLNLQGGKDG
ncbi:MAG TPA: phosphopantothenoylcysteine decarboxylase [bacterium]|nr:phosphopantothenoylcysteine decarboxylase [bacterium]